MAQQASSRNFVARALPALSFVLLAAAAALAPRDAIAGSVHPRLEAHLSAQPPDAMVPIIIVLEEQAKTAVAAAKSTGHRHDRARAVVNALQDVANRKQKPVLDALAAERARGAAGDVQPFWIFNGMATIARPEAIRRIAARPDVREVRLDAQIAPPRLKPAATPATASVNPIWNIAKINAPDVWALAPGYNGAGVVVGSFDTGVDFTHPDLASRYRGNHAISWFDPYHQHSTPFDNNGHGTHTTGTAVGGNASGSDIGVAPGAQWIAAKAWNDRDNATVSAFHRVFQWFLAPGGDPANAPDVINNSWGQSPPDCYHDFEPDLQAWRAAGIFSAFAAGNEGPGPATMLSPGNLTEAFAVGATDSDDLVADFSGQGPSQCDGAIKPEISAPGVGILSSLPGPDWVELDGTSMATPHVTGAAAVLLSIKPDLSVDDIESALAMGAQDLDPPGADNLSGAGRLDLLNSARLVLGVPLVGIRATTPQALEAGTVPGRFTVTRTAPLTDALTLTYTVTGTATSASDYVALPGSVTLPAGAASADIVVTPIDDNLAELDETVIVTLAANPAYIVSPATATVTIVSDELLPDLTMTALGAPPAAGAGLPITVTDTTRNQGGGIAAFATNTRFYLSVNSTLDASDVLLGSRAIPALAPSASDSGSVTLTIPAGTATGAYFLIAKADGDDTLLETSETNNTLYRSLNIGPDLVLATLTAPNIAGAGLPLTVTDTTINSGGAATPVTSTRFYLSTDGTLDASDVLLGSRSVAALAPSASDTGSATVTLPAGTATGAYYLIAKADGGDAVAELSETNNITSRALNVGPDLIVAALNVPGGGAGAPITVTDTTRNQGGGAAPATHTRFYLSTDSVLDAGDVLLGSRTVAALAPGASDTGSVTFTIPAGTATGSYYVVAKADGDDALVETNETNNVWAQSITIGADLAVIDLAYPSLAGAGLPITISDTTKNVGTGATPPTNTRFYLSTNTVLDAGDVLLGSRSVAALAPGASDTGPVTLTIPAGTATGFYYLIAKADGDDALAETNEVNNVLVRVITIGPDLVLSALTVPNIAGAGQPITVSDTTRNQGGGATAATVTRFYLSTSATLDASAVPLGGRSVAALAPNASDTGTVSLTIPAGTGAGSYFIVARADGDDVVVETTETNNTLYRALTVGPDLALSTLNAPNIGGAGLPITVSDTTNNVGGAATPATNTRFYLSVDSSLDAGDVLLGSRAIPALASGTTNSGSVTLTIPAGTATGSYYLIGKADGDDALAETNEANNFLVRSITIGPDLIVTALNVPAGGPGQPITVTDTVRNQGGGAAPATNTRFYLSSDSTLDAGDVLLGSRAVAAIAPGASNTGSVTLTIPASTATGSYYVIAKADGDDALAETNETNNLWAQSITLGADLAVIDMAYPSLAGAGLPITISDTTRNVGTGATPPTNTRFYLSTNTLLDAGDVLLGSRSVAALAPGASDTGPVTLTIPAGTATGFYYLIAKADGDDALAETNELNNVLVRVITIGPDLVVNALTAPAAAGAGQPFTVSDTTRNQGGGATPATVTRFYLSTNGTLDAGDVLLGGRSVAALAPGASDSGSVSLTIPAGTAMGTYYLIAKADGDDALPETSETNNTFLRILTVGADLLVSTVSAPNNAGAGLPLTVGDTTINVGGATTPPTSTRFYLSTDGTLDASDVLLGSRAVAALAPGASDTGSVTVTIPAGTPTGYYYLIAKADGDDAIAELNESNNIASRALNIGPDLTVTALSAPSGGAGAPITVTDTVRNQGGGAAPATNTRFYLSVDSVLDASDVLLGSRAVAALAPGASDTGSVTLTIPAGTATGYYYVIAKADGDNALAETNETNNVWAQSIAIGADLAVTNLAYPSAVGAGQPITISDTTKNLGSGAAPGTNTRFYLSTNTLLDGGDVLLGSRAVAALAAGASDSGSVTLTIPAGTAAGYYYLLAKADGDDALVEISEFNNVLVRVLQVTVP